MSYRTVSANPRIPSLTLDIPISKWATTPPKNPTRPMQQEVTRVQGPTPKKRSLEAMPRNPVAKPNAAPPIIPLTIDRKATGLTFGGPPARAILVTQRVLIRQASNARDLVRFVKDLYARRSPPIYRFCPDLSIDHHWHTKTLTT